MSMLNTKVHMFEK